MTRQVRDAGFSFIELLAYMAIAALLILAAVPQFENYRGRAWDSNITDDLRSISSTVEGATGANSIYPINATELAAQVPPLRVTKTAYRTDLSSSLNYCTDGTRFGFGAVSRSSRVYVYDSRSGIRKIDAAPPLGGAVIAAQLGFPSGANCFWLHNQANNGNDLQGWSNAIAR